VRTVRAVNRCGYRFLIRAAVGRRIMMSESKIMGTREQSTLPIEGPRSLPNGAAIRSESDKKETAFRIVAIERECACGAANISKKLSGVLRWKLWDELLTQELSESMRSDVSGAVVQSHGGHSRFCAMAKVFLRGSYERSAHLGDCALLDVPQMIAIMREVSDKIAREGNSVVVGRGIPGFFQDRSDTLRVFLYAPREEKIRRLVANGKHESEIELIESVDRERRTFVNRYFGADWPTRSYYNLMINTAIGEDNVISTILHTMNRIDDGRR
jgi:cytidylate kinase